jgi:hypothetical protein
MMFPSNRVRIMVATKPIDFRKGHDGFGQHHSGRLVEQAPQMGVSASGDMPVIIGFTGLVTARGQPDPGGD